MAGALGERLGWHVGEPVGGGLDVRVGWALPTGDSLQPGMLTGRPITPPRRSKHVAFPPRLRVKRSWLASDCGERGPAPEYELVSTVTHHGKAISSGHYTADVRQPGGK